MAVYRETFDLQTRGWNPTYLDVTEETVKILGRSNIKNGICVVFTQHTTCSIIMNEFAHDFDLWGNEYLHQDLTNIMEKIIPTCQTEGQYMHPGPLHLKWAAELVGKEQSKYALNTDAHLRSTIFGNSVTVVICDGKLQLGEWGHIYFVDWDQTRARNRNCQVQIIGE